MKKRKALAVFLSICVLTGSIATGCNKEKETSTETKSVVRNLTNVSYSSTREFYVAYNDLFADYWMEETGEEVEVQMSHGGSILQADAAVEEKSADVVTLAGARDVDSLAEENLLDKNWIKSLENESVPYTSAIVFLVRSDSKKEVLDWNNLTDQGIEVMIANPEISGGGMWSFLAAWAYAQQIGSERIALDFMKKLYKNVLIMYDDSRETVTNFVENGQGDVLVTWESEAYLALEAYPDDYKMITPSVSVLGQPVAAVVNHVAEKNDNTDIAKEYLEYLYSDEGQRLAGEHFFRPAEAKILQEFSNQFDMDMSLRTIEDLGGWEQVWNDCFAQDGIWEKVCPAE